MTMPCTPSTRPARRGRLLAVLAAACCLAGAAQAAELAVLSAGAIEPGLKAAAAAFEQQTGNTVRITFNTAPELRKKMAASPAFDVVIAPPAVIGEFAGASQLSETRANVGRVGMGVAVKAGAPLPDLSTPESLKQAVLAADSLVFNRASTGLYLESLLKKMAVYTQVESKTTRYPDGAAVMEHVLHDKAGKKAEIGFGAITEILLYQDQGLKFVGPVPAAVQNYTSYTAAPLASGKQQELAQGFVSFLAGPVSKKLFVAAGVTD
ncbi:MAG: ABC transporter substrate-binding protein [Comamonadaceae bacterium]|nr:MAG: ABC transporter substrate-binding protein [Comamonadaceae bacterium]